MTEDELKQAISDGLSQHGMAKRFETSQTNIRYWLHKYGLRSSRSKWEKHPYFCRKCGEIEPERFYGNKKSTCRKCTDKNIVRIGVDKKRKIVELMGGACVRCGYHKYDGALQMHHVDPSVKDREWTQLRNAGWERILEEIAKCVLLCANCHCEMHEELRKQSASALVSGFAL